MSVELVLAAVSAADLCLKYGKHLIGVYRDVKGADEAVRSNLLLIEAVWSKTAIQVEFVKRVAQVLEEEHCRVHLEVLEALKSKLTIAISKIESVVKPGSGSGVRKWKYARVRDAIDDSISQLQQWQSIFDPTWYLILRMGSSFIDHELSKQPVDAEPDAISTSFSASTSTTLVSAQSLRGALRGEGAASVHVSLPESGLDWGRTQRIRHSSTTIVKRPASEKLYAVDTISCNSGLDLSRLRSDVEGLAKKLKRDDVAEFGLLGCKGVVKRKDPDTKKLASMSFVFELPQNANNVAPVSLRHHLLQERTSSLSRVLDIAKQLARAVSFIHTFDFVHKNIRPETILVFPDLDSDTVSPLGSAFLLGFDSFRHVNVHTLKVGDDAWERNLYRHPTRQGIQVQEAYVMQHDVYSLGVCLLELGLWESFVQYQDLEDDTKQDIFPGEGIGLDLDDCTFSFGQTTKSQGVKAKLVTLAKTRLPLRMGDRYSEVVVTCLTCLDKDNDEFGDEEMQDEDGILVGVKFIERVLLRLGEMVL